MLNNNVSFHLIHRSIVYYTMQLIKYYLVLIGLLLLNVLQAQNYQAINGSSFAGSLGPSNNPASIVSVPFAWDITPIAVQTKQTTNIIKLEKYSLLSSSDNAEISLQNGEKKRYVFSNQDIRLFNTRISLNSSSAIAFGATIRSYSYAVSNKFNIQDSSRSLREFFSINNKNNPLTAEAAVSSWAELYGTYAQTIIDKEDKILNIGVTLKLNRSLAGGYGRAEAVNFSPSAGNNIPGYLVNSGNLQYGYSYNLDKIDSTISATANARKFVKNTYAGLSADIGLEYIFQANADNDEAGEYAYNTKIGISIMDIGNNKYSYGQYSSIAIAGKSGITDTLVEKKLSTISSVAGFNDSLASIAKSFTQLTGNFSIYQPTRLVVNVDQHIVHNFFVNTQLTVPFSMFYAENILVLKDINLLAITPRWEVKALGAYLPILFNNRNQLWVGAAFKAGPILLGTHNLANLFSKDKMQSGGFYLALTIRPGKIYNRAAHYPGSESSGKPIKNLSCPKF